MVGKQRVLVGVAAVVAASAPSAAALSPVKVVMGTHNTCALMDNEKLACWGSNYNWKAGLGWMTWETEKPFYVDLPGKVVDVTLSGETGCAVVLENNDKTAWCWGVGNEGGMWWEPAGMADWRIYDGLRPLPKPVAMSYFDSTRVPEPLAGVESIDLGAWYTVARLSGQRNVWTWGSIGGAFDYGQGGISYACQEKIDVPCGNETSADECSYCKNAGNVGLDGEIVFEGTPTESRLGAVEGDSVSKVAAGAFHTCILTGAGKVRCVGDNTSGALGVAGVDEARTPVDVVLPAKAVDIVAGDSFTCSLLETRALLCWGTNYFGILGNGATDNEVHTAPVEVALPDEPVQIAGGLKHVCVVTAAGEVVCWGQNMYRSTTSIKIVKVGNETKRVKTVSVCGGVIGLGSNTSSVAVPSVVDVGGKATSVWAGKGEHTCALLATGELNCWGCNKFSELGRAPANNTISIGDEPGEMGGELVSVNFKDIQVATVMRSPSGSQPVSGPAVEPATQDQGPIVGLAAGLGGALAIIAVGGVVLVTRLRQARAAPAASDQMGQVGGAKVEGML